MYRITIKTKFNTIVLEKEEYNTLELQEVYDQPYVEQIYIENLNKVKKLERKLRNERKQ